MVELSKKKIEVAQELSKATDELDFASEVKGSRIAFFGGMGGAGADLEEHG